MKVCKLIAQLNLFAFGYLFVESTDKYKIHLLKVCQTAVDCHVRTICNHFGKVAKQSEKIQTISDCSYLPPEDNM